MSAVASTRQPAAVGVTTPTHPASLAVYLRVSTEGQKRQGTIEQQRNALDRYLAVQGTTPYGWYEDEAWSGHFVPFAERPNGRRLMADITAGHVQTVLVSKLDRFGRNAREILNAVHDLEAAGAHLVSLKENVDTSTSAGRFFLTVLAGVAQLEADMIHERTEAGAAQRIDRGGWMGGRAPYGYVLVGRGKASVLVVDADTAAVVRRIYRLTVEHGWATQRIADQLNADGVPTAYRQRGERFHRGDRHEPAMGIWRANQISGIIKNPVYRGQYVYGRHTREDTSLCPVIDVDALVDAPTWEAAQQVLRAHLKWSRRNAHRDYLMRGLMRCGLCGLTYVGESERYLCNGKRRAVHLYGRAQANAHRCPSVGISAAWVEGEIWAEVQRWLNDPGVALDLLAQQLRGQADQSEALRADIAGVQQQLDAKQAERDKVVGAYQKSLITERDLTRNLDALAAEETQLTAQMQHLQRVAQDASAVEASLVTAGALLTKLHTGLDTGAITRREAVEALVSSIVIQVKTDGKKPHPHAVVTYVFDAPAVGVATSSYWRSDSRRRSDLAYRRRR